jgi:hypothetical protein
MGLELRNTEKCSFNHKAHICQDSGLIEDGQIVHYFNLLFVLCMIIVVWHYRIQYKHDYDVNLRHYVHRGRSI